jgi:hypothetical protein
MMDGLISSYDDSENLTPPGASLGRSLSLGKNPEPTRISRFRRDGDTACRLVSELSLDFLPLTWIAGFSVAELSYGMMVVDTSWQISHGTAT